MKFDSARDAILSAMVSNGWANESDGNVEAPTGWFARITNRAADLHEIVPAFGYIYDELDASEEESLSDLLGHFLITEDSSGFVYVDEFDTKAELIRAYNGAVMVFSDWMFDDDDI